MVSPLSPEVRQGIQRVINYLEDMYAITVKPVMVNISCNSSTKTKYMNSKINIQTIWILFYIWNKAKISDMDRAMDLFTSAVEHEFDYAPPLR